MNDTRQAPVVVTPRLILRAYAIEDFPHVAATWADTEVVRYISGGRPFTEDVLFRAGDAYQRETDWHTRQPQFDVARRARPGEKRR